MERSWTDGKRAMRMFALKPANVNRDDSIRPWTEAENETLVAYMGGGLHFLHPPNFVKEVMTAEHRAIVEDFHDRYLDVTLTASLQPTVHLSKRAPHAEIFKDCFTQIRSRALQAGFKWLVYDGLHTLNVGFYSRHAAARWVRKALRLQRAVIILQDTTRPSDACGDGTFMAVQLEQQYNARVYGAAGFSLVTLIRAFQLFFGAAVLDVEHDRASMTDIYDNR
jgi:hypothetical protein